MQGWDKRPKALQILGRGAESLWQIVTSVPLLLPSAIAAYALVSIGVVQLSNFLPVSASQESEFRQLIHGQAYGNVLPLQLLQLAATFLTAGISAIPCIIVIRHILLGETGGRLPSLSILWPYAAWNFALEALVLVSGQLQYFFFDAWWAYLVPIIMSFTLSVLFSMVFPGIAISNHCDSVWDRARYGLRHVRGNFWLLVRAYLILFAATITAVWLPYLPGFLFSQNPIEIAPTSWEFLSFEAMIEVAGACIAAAMLAWLHAWVAPPKFLENFD